MKSLKEIYNDIIKEDDRWSYYANPCLLEEKVFVDCDRALNFIKKYYNLAGKGRVFEDSYITKNEKYLRERSPHIISTFLLGIKLAEMLNIDTQRRNYNNMNFLYYWFLTALYHDVGYVYEKNNKINSQKLKKIQNEGLNAIKEFCGIKYLCVSEFRTYSIDNVEVYLKNRAKGENDKEGKIDHGIAGGLMLYDKLRRQFETAWENRTCGDSRESFCINKNGRRLHLSKSHYRNYEKAANAIIAHNIFKNTLIGYYENNEKEIESLRDKTITRSDELCFILSIADTIEPLKRKENLESIFVEETKQGFVLKLTENANEKFGKSILELKDWVNIDVVEAEENDDIGFVKFDIKYKKE